MRNLILAIFSLLIIFPIESAKAQDKTVLVKFNSFYVHPVADSQDCTSTGRLTNFNAILLFKNGSRLANWEGSTTADNGKIIHVKIELVQANSSYQMAIIAEDEKSYPILAYRTLFAPTDTLVSRGFYVNAFSDLPVCRENLILTVNSIKFG